MTVDNEAVRGLFRVMFLVMEISDRIAAQHSTLFGNVASETLLTLTLSKLKQHNTTIRSVNVCVPHTPV